MLSRDLRDKLLVGIKSMSHEDMVRTLALIDELEERERREMAQNDFLAFIAAIDPQYKFGAHLKRLGALLMEVEVGHKDRVAVSMAPRFGKSQMISIYYPAWYLGRHPQNRLIMASHTGDLAVDMARKVRNLMQTPEYKAIFPGVSIAGDAKAAGKWNTTKGGEVFAVGVGGAIAGRGADLIVVDDPLSEQDLKAGNTSQLDVVYEWFRSGLRTRLMPGGKIAVLHCLTGDTAVTLADGSTKAIRDVRPGDVVASYVAGELQPAKVLGWSNQGLDHVYSLQLRSGVVIRGNERHPLLVNQDGEERWVKIKDLRVGAHLVAAASRSAETPITLGVSANTTTTSCAARTPLSSRLPTGVSGRASSALLRGAWSLLMCTGCVWPATTSRAIGRVKPPGPITARKSEVAPISRCATGSPGMTTTGCSVRKVGTALYAGSLLTTETPPQSGKHVGSLLTTTMARAKSALCSAMNAICSSKSGIQSSGCNKPLSTYSVTLDEVVSIAYSGVEEVFDIQVEGAENFLANGVVSHNTRWHQRDLIGRLLKDGVMNPDGDVYEMFEFPAILEVKNPIANPDHAEYDPQAPRFVQKSLWPEQWSLESLLKTKASMPAWQWNSQYQQNPTSQEAAIIKRDHIQWWPKADPPQCEFIVQAYDTALTTKERSDYSVCQTWGVFKNDEGVDQVILLNCVRGKYEFPELKRMAHEQFKDWEPDSVIVEAKASGQPLIDEMRRSGIFVQDYSPGKGQDKIARVNAISDMFFSGQVWFPETWWASEVVEELLAFPAGEHDDLVDALTLALIRIRKGGMVRLTSDADDEVRISLPRKAAYY